MRWLKRRYNSLTWLQRYRFRETVRRSLWIPPLGAIFLALVIAWPLHWLEAVMRWQIPVDPGTTLTLLSTLAAAMFTFIVFVCSSLLITVQLASAQLTPRMVGVVLQDRVTRFSLALFVFTFTFTLAALVRIKGPVAAITPYVAVYSCLASLGVSLYLIDHICSLLRPSGALMLAARIGRRVLTSVYPTALASEAEAKPPTSGRPDADPLYVVASDRDGVLLAFDPVGLIRAARRPDCVIELVPQVGDFVSAGQPLFRIFGQGEVPPAEKLLESVAIGAERTLEQDPTFVFRIMVDIASKGLSPAINDPTTAVMAIDHIQPLLQFVGCRELDTGRVVDARGDLRVVYRTPSWEDFVCLAVTEIRQFGGTSIQIARRLRAMLQDLLQSLPPERAALIWRELKLLDRSIQRSFPDDEDRLTADIADFQGVGGSSAGRTHAVPAPRASVGGNA